MNAAEINRQDGFDNCIRAAKIQTRAAIFWLVWSPFQIVMVLLPRSQPWTILLHVGLFLFCIAQIRVSLQRVVEWISRAYVWTNREY